jgi:hypothetical protein
MRGILGIPLVLLACGCTAPPPSGPVTSPNPEVKIPAMKRAVAAGDLHAARQLVKDLESDDPAIRLYAIYSLEELTGERYGYDYFAEPDDRAKAVERWKSWLAQQETRLSATQPTTQSAAK